MEDQLLSTWEAVSYTRLSRPALYKLRAAGKIRPARMYGNNLFWNKADLEPFVRDYCTPGTWEPEDHALYMGQRVMQINEVAPRWYELRLADGSSEIVYQTAIIPLVEA